MKWYTNLKITNKLVFGFLVLAIIAAIVGGFGMLTITQLRAIDKKLYEENAVALQYAGTAALGAQMVMSDAQALSKMDASSNISNIKKSIDTMATEMASVDELINKLQGVLTTQDTTDTLADISKNWTDFKTYVNVVGQSMTKKDGASAANGSLLIATPLLNKISASYTALIQQISDEADGRAQQNSAQSTVAIIVMAVILVAGIVLSLVLGNIIARSIGGPLKSMAAAGDKLAVGDVDVDSVLSKKDYELKERKDEIGALAQMFDKLISGTKQQSDETKLVASGDLTVEIALKSARDQMGLSLRELVSNFHELASNIVTAAEQLASSSGAVSNSSLVLSQGATEQASSIEELNATLEEISSQTSFNAENATKANELAQKAKTNAVTGNKQMQEMLTAMQEISESSRNINKVIKVIDDIAFQTNILALNAAVEAARAGQAGRGFAVVAEEVRALAARSANAVKDTAELIDGSIRKVTAGTKIANDTAQALNDILVQVDKAAELVSAIDEASKEQALGIQQINQGISQVSQVVQTNAATAEESAAASEQMSSQAAQLKEQVGVFKLKKLESIYDEDSAYLGQADDGDDDEQDGDGADQPGDAVQVALSDEEFGKY
ncbi:methyl-accepting chemotaxis protein [Sporobacter termitidis DSM 10068]|uniref:Methyl-accepting chemotaxis protein n=1 Tax=Sporobacter termitidis DSM 10068 TaxID=1123282 RepID=A0A1M5UFK5_9FIRM|nr:methyl-accepting chemotaxis protein [Sporobacter termitidis]SHH61835.1 methyl-accepting chemotaxis protein [Sporobacter termitidis DSM 10068]